MEFESFWRWQSTDQFLRRWTFAFTRIQRYNSMNFTEFHHYRCKDDTWRHQHAASDVASSQHARSRHMNRPKVTACNGVVHSGYVSNAVMTLATVMQFISGQELCILVYNFQMSTVTTNIQCLSYHFTRWICALCDAAFCQITLTICFSWHTYMIY